MRIVLLSLLPLLLFGAADVKKIARKIEMLQHEKMLENRPQYSVYDPFRRAKPLLAKKTAYFQRKNRKFQSLHVETILNGKAFINGRWIGVGEKISGAKVVNIRQNSVVVVYNKKSIYIPVVKPKRVIKFKETIR